MGVAVNREKYSFPVGKVDTLTMYPMDFEEFLWAQGKEALCGEIREHYQTGEAMTELLHKKAIELYRYYLITGGMPSVVNSYVNTGKLVLAAEIQSRILNDYIADMAKYAGSSESVKIRACYNSIPAQLAKDNKKF